MATLNEDKLKKRRKKRRLAVLLLSWLELTFSPLIVFWIHQVFIWIFSQQGKGELLINTNYFTACRMCFENMQVQSLWIGAEILWVLMMVFLTLNEGAAISQVDTMMITPDIEKPVSAGNGQYGKERFLTEEEKKELFGVFVFTGNEVPEGQAGLVVQMIKKGNKEEILYLKADLHTLTIGASGAGKTRRILLVTIWLQLLSGISILASDVKSELYYYTSPFAKMLGYKVIYLDLRTPEKSMHYNYLQPILNEIEKDNLPKAIDYTWDLVAVLVGEKKGEPIWYNGECASIAASTLLVAMDAPQKCKNLTNVYYFLAYMCEPDEYGEIPLNKLLKTLPDNHPAKGVFQQAKIAPYKTRSSFYTSALGTLRLFTNPNIAEMTAYSDFDLKDISREKTIFYMMIPDEKKTNYPLVSLLITQAYMLQVELANEHGLTVPVPTDYDLDELGNFPTIPVLPELVSAGRSRGIRLNGIIQDYQQLEKKYKEDFKNIKANCQLKIYLKSDDPDTLKNISESLGKYTVEVSGASTSVSDSINRKDGVNYSSSANLAACDLLSQAEIKRIKAPYSVCMMTGEYAGINELPDISEYRLNKIYGMGDREHNNNLIMQRESKRDRNPIVEPELWGIWRMYQEQEEAEEQTGTKRVSFLK